METVENTKIIQFPHRPGSGGPGSFQIRFEAELRKNNWQITYAGDNIKPTLIFIVGGTKKIFWLLHMKFLRVPIIYRLDGIKWLHKKKKTTLKKYLKASLINYISKFIHAYIASTIIYQSKFVENWWKKEGWKNKKYDIIYNGVVIPSYSLPNEIDNKKRLVILEGTIDYSPYAVKLLNQLAQNLPNDITIEVYGNFEDINQQKALNPRLNYKGYLNPQDVNSVLKGAVYLSLDINPACPNTVIEALANAAPVVAYDTGSLAELIDDNCGRLVPYGSNPWVLQFPDADALTKAISEIFTKYNLYSKNAYERACNNFSMDKVFNMYNAYLTKYLRHV